MLAHKYSMEVLQAGNAAKAVQLCQSQPPALVLLETMMPGLDSFSAALDIRRDCPAAKIAILTRYSNPEYMLRVRQHRLNGFILKTDSLDELYYALHTILNGGFYTPPSMSTLLRDQVPGQDLLSILTQREKSVLTLYAQGWSQPAVETRPILATNSDK